MSVLTARPESRRTRIFVLVCMILLALNLRAAVGSLGVLLGPVSDDLGMSATVGGVLTTLPVLCFAAFGVLANTIVRVIGLHRTAALAIAFIAAGLAARALTDSTVVFIATSAAALAGGAVGNVILPPLVKLHFPDRVGAVSALYTASIMAGASLSATVTVPVADAAGGWRIGLMLWAVAAFVTLLPWIGLLRRDVHASMRERSTIKLPAIIRSPLAWVMAVFFALQSAQAYAQFGWLPQIFTDAGLTNGEAGLMQGLLTGVGIPMALSLPYLMRKLGNRPYLPWLFGSVTVTGWLGVLIAPTAAPWAWAVLLGIGGGAFPWGLTMLGHKTRSHDGTAALSSFVQGLGYLFASAGPLGTGVLHDLSGSWTVPLLVLTALAAGIAVLGTVICRPVMFEDTLRAPSG
ncbi:MAG: CynX/NimT family MFS transporter [Nocardioidaceae bacterium]